jgi:hypothetical protein
MKKLSSSPLQSWSKFDQDCAPYKNGRTGEIRTRDQRIKSPLLYRLSYRPIFMALPNVIQGFIGLLAVKKRLLVKFSPANLKL